MNTRQLTLADLKATPPVLTEDAIIGIDRALSIHQRLLQDAIADGASIEDYMTCLRAAQSWLMHVQACR
jgi:hypothetical protein